MSSSADLEILLFGKDALLEAARLLGAAVREAQQLRTSVGKKHAVEFVIREGDAEVGVKLNAKTGAATFIPVDCNGGKGKALAGRIAQRHAYSKLMEELARKGYQISKEQRETDGSIRLVATRWK